MLLLAAMPLLAACENPTGPERDIEGQQIFDRHCARCHGTDGKGSKESPSAKDLTNLSYMRTLSDERIRMTIHNGRPPAMPGFQGQFAEPSLKVLVAYVRSLSDPSVVGSTKVTE